MYTITPVTGHIGGECYLLTSENAAILLDAGFDFCAGKTVDNIRAVLGKRPLEYILATHTHYDHISGAPAIKRCFPSARLVGGQHAKKVLASDGAKAVMRSLNNGYARDCGMAAAPDLVGELALDVVLEDGEELRLPGLTVRAVATPGHTRCSMSYHFPEEELLVCSETLGITPQYPRVVPGVIVGYRLALDAIERSRMLKPRRVFVSHYGLIPEGEADRFFDNSRNAVEEMAAMLLELHAKGCGERAMLEAFTEKYYHASAAIQPKRAFDLNISAMIPRILGEFGRTLEKTA